LASRLRSWFLGGQCWKLGKRGFVLIPIRENSGAVTFTVKVHPRAKRDAITGEVGDALKIALTAPPVDGKANEACVRFLAEILRVPRSSVTIAAGETSRNKVIRVAGANAAQVEECLRAAY
jgi:uncharacterized protein (TIGR00251 family)